MSVRVREREIRKSGGSGGEGRPAKRNVIGRGNNGGKGQWEEGWRRSGRGVRGFMVRVYDLYFRALA